MAKEAAPPVDIQPPYGYQDIVPLTKQHRVLLPEARKLPLVFRNLTALPLSYTEFAAACRDYPIAFVSSDGGKSFIAMAVLGLENQQNLFVTADGGWDAGVYLPAYVRRYPFCMTRITVNGQEQAERIACVEKRAINDKGDALYDAKGEPLPVWEERRKLLFEYEADLVRSDEMSRTLSQLGLLETFTMQAVPNQGEPLAMTGMYRVAEQKLGDLAPEKLKELTQKGILARVYAHLISLNNFGRLLDRRAGLAKQAAGAPARGSKKLN
ncbi:MAG: SapC family protein [Betaproteobacteria bacterium]|nr:SapC family protein [Betaproteobacteria bacterium]MBI2509901.1 SapC family protein [Betaproteobacteria bacterium]